MNAEPEGLTVEAEVHFRRGRRGRKHMQRGEKPKPPAVRRGHVPRLSRLMALAIRFERLIREGAIKDYAALARLGHVSRGRITQIMDLLNLAPDIQAAILYLPRTTEGRDPITEPQVRPITRIPDWRKQRRLWRRLNGRTEA